MQSLVAAAAVLLAAQLGDQRYGQYAAGAGETPEAAAAETTSNPFTAAADTAAATPIHIQLTPDTPQPTLAAEDNSVPPLGRNYGAPASAVPAQPSYQQPQASGYKPSELIEVLARTPKDGGLAGLPMTLAEAVGDEQNRRLQTQRAQAYWDLSAAATDYYLARLEASELALLGQNFPGSLVWQSAEQKVADRIELARQEALAAQIELHRLLGRGEGVALPVPVDVPHCGRYETRFGDIFGERPAAAAEQLAELLPLQYASLRQQAQDVSAASSSINEASRRLAADASGAALLAAHDKLVLRRREFVDALRQYNRAIASYAELAVPSQTRPERLVAMLIRTSTGSNDSNLAGNARPDAAVRPASAEDPEAGQSWNDPAAESTANAAAQQRRETRRPILPLFGRERSILRPFRQGLGN